MRPGFILERLRRSVFSIRMLLVLIIWFFMMDLYLSGYREYVMSLGEKDTIVILPFLQNGFYFTKTILLGSICFFSDIPFMQRDEMYCLARLGRKKWGYSNLIVIACSGVILSLLLFLLSILQVLPVGRLQNDWGSVFHSFAVWKNDLALGLEINYAAMYAYTPFQLAVRVLIVDAPAFTFLGMLLYTVSLCFSRMAAYAAAVIVVFLPSIIAKFPQYSLLSYSPFSWIEPANWRYEGNLDCPDMVYICIGFLLLIFLLAVVAQGRIKKVDWKEKENQH